MISLAPLQTQEELPAQPATAALQLAALPSLATGALGRACHANRSGKEGADMLQFPAPPQLSELAAG